MQARRQSFFIGDKHKGTCEYIRGKNPETTNKDFKVLQDRVRRTVEEDVLLQRTR